MRIFALETDLNKIMERFCHGDECEVLRTHFHGMSFALAIVREVCITLVLVAAIFAGFFYNWPMGWTFAITGALFLFFVVPSSIKAYMDWMYDYIVVTTDKVIFVDQTSFFHNEIKPIQFDNIGGVSARTQWLGLFSFGEVVISLKEGEGGGDVVRRYVPQAREVAGILTEAVTTYQRKAYGHGKALYAPDDPL